MYSRRFFPPICLVVWLSCRASQPNVVQRFELFIGGKEVVNAYVELNDPDIQTQRFSMQAKVRRAPCGWMVGWLGVLTPGPAFNRIGRTATQRPIQLMRLTALR